MYEYRVRAVDATERSTPWSEPVVSDLLFDATAQAFDAVAQPNGSVRVDFHVGSTDPTANYEYALMRMTSSTGGWVEIHRGPLSEYQTITGGYRFIDTAPVANAYNYYNVQAIAPGARSENFVGDYRRLYIGGPLVQPLVDAQLTSERAVADSEEVTIGHFLPLNNNFNEFNNDEFDELVPDNEPDYEDGHNVNSGPVGRDPQLGRMHVSIEGGTGTIEFVFPASIKLWGTAEIVSGVVYDLDSTGLPFLVGATGITFDVEGVLPSTLAADVELVVHYIADAQPSPVQEDRVRFTVGDLFASPAPDIAVDANELYISVPLVPGITMFDGEVVDVRLYKQSGGSIYVETQQAVIENGSAVAVFDVRPRNGEFFYIDTRFRDHEFSGLADYFLVQPGDAAAIALSATKTSYTADGTDVTVITATICDKFGNLVADGTPVSWSIPFGGGVYTDDTSTAATETMNGQATITLRAPDEPGVQHIVASAGVVEAMLDIVAEAADFDLGGVTAFDIATGQLGTVSITNANVADGTPVFWTLSNGQIVDGEDGGRVLAGTVLNGTASVTISATGPWARFGLGVVTATIAGRLHYHEVDFGSTAPFAVELEYFVLSGDKTTDGVETLNFESPNPTFQGEPLWGFTPPPAQEWPAPRVVEYFAETAVMIHGQPNTHYYVVVDSPFSTFAALQGLGSNNEIQTDANGNATFTIRSLGQLADNQFLAIDFTVRQGTPDPFVGAPERTDRLELVEHGFWTRMWDGVKGFTGLGDPQTATGVAAGIAGSQIIIADAGSIAKNAWRMTPFSDVDPNYVEVGFSGLGLLTEIFIGLGEAPDAAVGVAKNIAAATRGSKLNEIMWVLVKRAQSNAQEAVDLGRFLLSVGRTQFGLQVAKEIFTSEALVEAGIRAVSRLDGLGRDFVDILARKASVSGIGIRAAQDVTTLMSRLSDDAINFFKALPTAQLDVAIEHMGFILAARKVDVGQLNRMLNNNLLFTAAYNRSQMLDHLRVVAEAEGVSKLANYLGAAAQDGWAKGRIYELQSAAAKLEEARALNPNAKARFFSKYAFEVDPNTGKVLDRTDIDFIVDDGTNLIYYQAKSTAGAFKTGAEAARLDAERWVNLARADAIREGITNQLIKYVVPPEVTVPPSVVAFFAEFEQRTGVVIEVVTSPLAR